jgi:hypothetical protein
LETLDGSIYAVTGTTDAREIIRIRDKCGYNIYHSNFRYLLTRGGVARPKIIRTLEDPLERRYFWRYNNGITVCCQTVVEQPSEVVTTLQIEGFQVVNGLQTIETLYDCKDRDGWLDGVQVMIRIIPTRSKDNTNQAESRLLEERIANFSNSQTPIKPRDLRANDIVQHEIERIMLEIYGLTYIRKTGKNPAYRGIPLVKRVDNMEAAQSALSFWYGLSKEAKGSTRLLFEKNGGFYDKIFNNSTVTEYVLLPKLLWDNQYELIAKISNNAKQGSYKLLDLLTLAVLGNIFKKIFGLAEKPTRSAKVGKKLKSSINHLRGLNELKRKKFIKNIWKPILEELLLIAESRRKTEASAKGLNSPEEIPIRNIIIKMTITDDNLKTTIMNNPRIRSVSKFLKKELT